MDLALTHSVPSMEEVQVHADGVASLCVMPVTDINRRFPRTRPRMTFDWSNVNG